MKTSLPIALRVGPAHFIEISSIEKFSDGSGYSSRLSVSSDRFSCQGHPFDFDNLKKFAEDLAEVRDRLQGKARLGHPHEKDFLEVAALGLGHIIVTGFIVQWNPRHELRFAFECDQTFIPPLLESLRQVNQELG